MTELQDDGTMTADRMRWLLDRIGWSLRELARRINTNEKTVRRMAMGQQPIPENLAAWLERLGTFHASNSAPLGWRNTNDSVQYY